VYAIIVAAHASPSIRIERAPPGPRLRELRNIAVARARGEWMTPYPDIGLGEDTLQTLALLQAEASKALRVSRLRGMGWCDIYRFHGGDASPRVSALFPRSSASLRPASCRVWPCCGIV
jgi:hypothetical protein